MSDDRSGSPFAPGAPATPPGADPPAWPAAPGPGPEPVPGGAGWHWPDPDAGLPVGARRRQGTTGYDVLLIIGLSLMGLLLMANIAQYVLSLVVPAQPVEPSGAQLILMKVMMWVLTTGLLLVAGGVPLLWAVGTRVGRWEGAKAYLHLHTPGTSLLRGLGLGIGLAATLIGLELLARQIGWDPGNEGLETTLMVLDWPLVVFISLVAGFSEEILFRGVLQKWLGVWGQAGLFGLFHLSQGLLGFVVTGLIGLLFGLLVRRGVSLWMVIAAHAVYDLMIFSWALGGF